MHMSDALITPLVGSTMLATSMSVVTNSTRKLDSDFIEQRLPYMGVVGAFVFASQMINFAIPGTGSSGHIGGGMLLAILLGPQAGFLTMASVLLVQALFFADGGLLAFGCNLINLGFFTCFVAYPYLYKPLVRQSKGERTLSKRRIFIGSIVATVVGLQLGSLGVVIQTMLSGRTDLPFGMFLMFMQPIHLAIGLVEGIITAVVVAYLYAQRADLHYDIFSMHNGVSGKNASKNSYKGSGRILQLVLIATILIGGFFSLYASGSPDGLEWSIEKVSAEAAAYENTSDVAEFLSSLQERVAFLPDYGFREGTGLNNSVMGTSFSGLAGSMMTLALVTIIGLTSGAYLRNRRRKSEEIG